MWKDNQELDRPTIVAAALSLGHSNVPAGKKQQGGGQFIDSNMAAEFRGDTQAEMKQEIPGH